MDNSCGPLAEAAEADSTADSADIADRAAQPDPDLAGGLASDPATATDAGVATDDAAATDTPDLATATGGLAATDTAAPTARAGRHTTQDANPGDHPDQGDHPGVGDLDSDPDRHSGDHRGVDRHPGPGDHPGPTSRPDDGSHIDPGGAAEPAGDAGSQGWCAGNEPWDDHTADVDREPPCPGDPMGDRPHDPWAPRDPSGTPDPEPADPAEAAQAAEPAEAAQAAAPAGAAQATEPADAAGPALDDAARLELRRQLAAIRHDAYRTGLGATGRRPAPTTLYVHITDQTLLDGDGVARVERFGPVLAARLEELLGHGQIVIKPVIDLNDNRINVNAYEVPRELRERLKLTYPVEQFPYGAAETTDSTDLDHITPYDFTDTGPPGQTSIANLTPLRRYSHRVKTHGHWASERLDDGALEWTTPHGFKFRVDHTGTHALEP